MRKILITALFGADCGDPEREITEFRRRYLETPTPAASLYPEVRSGLTQLANSGARLSLCSNKPQALCEKVLGDLGLADLFDAVVGSHPSLPSTPHPALFDKALRLAGGTRARSCFIGDEASDQALSQAIGVPFIFARYGYAQDHAPFDPATSIDGFAQAPAMIEKLVGAARAQAFKDHLA